MNPGDLVKLRGENISGQSTPLFCCRWVPWELELTEVLTTVEFSKEETGLLVGLATNPNSGITYAKILCPAGVGWIMDLVLREVE